MASNLGNPPPVGGQATGLSASQLQDLVNDVRELYCCRATDSIFTKWYATDAAFTDPLGHLSPRIAFKGLAELFEPEPPNLRRFDVIEASNDVIKIALETGYYIKVPLAGRVGPLPFSCTTVLKLNKEGRVVQHEDNWARQLWHAEDGVIGKLADARRRLTGGMQWCVAVGDTPGECS